MPRRKTRTPPRRMSRDEWIAMAEQMFGKISDHWRFVCPSCGNVATVADYRPFQKKGATPDSAATECIGRYVGGRSTVFERGDGPCDYAAHGPFRLSPVVVVDGKEEMRVFAFGPATREVA